MCRDGERGITLIELLIVLAIIGILAAIAIPASREFRQKAFESTVLSDVHNAITVEETYFTDNHAYKAFGPFTGGDGTTHELATGLPLSISENVTLSGTLNSDGSLVITGTHPGSTGAITDSTTMGPNP